MEDIFSENNLPILDISLLTAKKDEKPVEIKPVAQFGGFDKETTIETDEPEIDETDDDGKTKPLGALNEENGKNKDNSATKIISSFLKEKGIIDFTDEEFKDEDDFISEQVSKQIKTGVDSYKETLPSEIQQLIENYEEGVPLASLLESEQKFYDLSLITQDKIREDSKLQEELVEAYLIATGWTKAETDERITELQDAGIMEKDALHAHRKLMQVEKNNKATLIHNAKEGTRANEIRYQAQVKQLESTIKDTKEFFDGVPTNDNEKKKVFEAITKYDKNGRNKITQLLNNPKTYIQVAYFLEVLGGDISKLKTTAKTAAINGIRKTLDTPIKTESRFSTVDLSIMKKALNGSRNFLK